MGANLYTDCIVALDPDNGELKWYNQLIPHDVWDWDTTYEQVLVDLPVGGKERKLLVHPSKGGYTWVLDRTNGEFVGAWPLVENINWISGIDENGNLLGRYEPPVDEPSIICPAIGGGRSWNHAAYSPRTGLLYTTGIEWCQGGDRPEGKSRNGVSCFWEASSSSDRHRRVIKVVTSMPSTP